MHNVPRLYTLLHSSWVMRYAGNLDDSGQA